MGFVFHTEKTNFEEETRFCAHTPYKTGVQRCAKSMWRQWTEAITRKSYVRTYGLHANRCVRHASSVRPVHRCYVCRLAAGQEVALVFRTGDLTAAQTVFCAATPVAAADTGACCAEAVMAGSAGQVTTRWSPARLDSAMFVSACGTSSYDV